MHWTGFSVSFEIDGEIGKVNGEEANISLYLKDPSDLANQIRPQIFFFSIRQKSPSTAFWEPWLKRACKGVQQVLNTTVKPSTLYKKPS